MEVRNSKAATFKSFFHLSLKNTITFFVTGAPKYFYERNTKGWFLELTQKYELRVSFKNQQISKVNQFQGRNEPKKYSS